MSNPTGPDQEHRSNLRSLAWWLTQIGPALLIVSATAIGTAIGRRLSFGAWWTKVGLAIALVVFGLIVFRLIQNRWLRLCVALSMAVAVGVGGVALYRHVRPPSKITILVAEFDRPDSNRGITETVYQNLREATKPFEDIELQALERHITEQRSEDAKREGEKAKATIVIWGRYMETPTFAGVAVHFTLLNRPIFLPELGPEAEGKLQRSPISELNNFTLHARLSDQLTYLSLTVVGLARYSSTDWGGAIAPLSAALQHAGKERVRSLDQSVVYYFRGTAYVITGSYGLGIRDLSKAIKLNPRIAMAYANRGSAYALTGKYQRAIADFDKSLSLEPKDATAYENRARAHARRGNDKAALSDITKAIELEPDMTRLIARGELYADLGEDNLAIADFKEALRYSPAQAAPNGPPMMIEKGNELPANIPQQAHAYIGLARIFSEDGDKGQAVHYFTEAIRLVPHYAVAYLGRGLAYMEMEDIEPAQTDFNAAIKYAQEGTEGNGVRAGAYIGRAGTYQAQGDFGRAIADLTQAIEFDDAPSGSLLLRGEVHQRLGDVGAAKADFIAARKFAENDREKRVAERHLAMLD
jgi:tetratricopeptide (TPR) repeat protein